MKIIETKTVILELQEFDLYESYTNDESLTWNCQYISIDYLEEVTGHTVIKYERNLYDLSQLIVTVITT